jgi:hypothetical protein
MIHKKCFKKQVLALVAVVTFAVVGVSAGQPSTDSVDLVSPFFYTGSGDFSSGFGLQGIKGSDTEGTFIITGTSNVNGVVYNGPVNHGFTTQGSGTGTWYVINVPPSFNASSTSIYGPDNLGGGNVNLVGSYVSGTLRIGFFYAGPLTNTPSDRNFLSYQGRNLRTGQLADFTYIHSVSSGLAVGNYGFQGEGNPFGHAFIYNPRRQAQPQKDIVFPDTDKTHTAYGIWYNGGSSYTIAGGVGLPSGPMKYGDPFGVAYLMDYDSATGRFSNYQTFDFKPQGPGNQDLRGRTILTHFEGIWSDGTGLYKLPATVSAIEDGVSKAFVVYVQRQPDGRFSTNATWSPINIPGASVSTNDSIFADTSVGLVTYPNIPGQQPPEIVTDYAVTPIIEQH